jgi:hypothetical protein
VYKETPRKLDTNLQAEIYHIHHNKASIYQETPNEKQNKIRKKLGFTFSKLRRLFYKHDR